MRWYEWVELGALFLLWFSPAILGAVLTALSWKFLGLKFLGWGAVTWTLGGATLIALALCICLMYAMSGFRN